MIILDLVLLINNILEITHARNVVVREAIDIKYSYIAYLSNIVIHKICHQCYIRVHLNTLKHL